MARCRVSNTRIGAVVPVIHRAALINESLDKPWPVSVAALASRLVALDVVVAFHRSKI
jgi:hypothetical protein